MKIFRYSFRSYLIFIVIVVIFSAYQFFILRSQDFHCMIAIIFSIIAIIDLLITKIMVDDNGITFRSLYQNITLSWNDINAIVKASRDRITLDAPKRIYITTWIKDYDLLLKLIVDNVVNNNKTIIDLEVWKIIQQK